MPNTKQFDCGWENLPPTHRTKSEEEVEAEEDFEKAKADWQALADTVERGTFFAWSELEELEQKMHLAELHLRDVKRAICR